jgi:uncharacterized protein YkvS
MLEPSMNGTEVNSIILYVLLCALSLLVGSVVFFVKQLIGKVNKMWDKLLVMEVTISNFHEDMHYVRSTKNDFRDRFEDIAVLKRDQTSIWKKLDAIQSRVGMPQ